MEWSRPGAAIDPATLVVPRGEPVAFRLDALDVIHAMWVPDLRFKKDAIPGRTNRFDLTFPSAGYYSGMGECSEFCGLYHANMRFNVSVLEPAAFRAWLTAPPALGGAMSTTTAPARPLSRGVLVTLAGTDHKSIGARVFATAFGFFLLAGILAVLMRTELAEPGLQLFSHQGYNELFTIHGSTMFYLFAAPIALGLGVWLVPLQIGATGLRWGRLALAGWWLILIGGIVMWSGFLTTQGAFAGGWYAYVPLSGAADSPGTGADFWIAGVMLAAAGSMALAATVLATIVSRRAPGMTMLRLPVFTWTQVVTCLMTLTAFPALLVAMGLLYADRLTGANVFSPAHNGPLAYQHLFWFFGHPVVYVVFFPRARGGGRGDRDVLRSSLVRLPVARRLAARLHRPVDVGVGPSHVHDRRRAQPLLLADLDGAARAGGDRVLRLGGDDVARADPLDRGDALRAGLPRPLPRRRADGHLGRLATARLPRHRLVLHRRPLPLHALRRHASWGCSARCTCGGPS